MFFGEGIDEKREKTARRQVKKVRRGKKKDGVRQKEMGG